MVDANSKQQTHPMECLMEGVKVSLLKFIIANKMYMITKIIYDPRVIMLESFFLYGRLMNKNSDISTELNMRMGNANIGFVENTEIINA